MGKQLSEALILLDADVVRHFINGGRILHLQNIYPKRLVMIDKVKDELCRSRNIEPMINNLIAMTGLQIMAFPKEIAVIKEYATLKKTLGDGESACLAVARHQKQFVASSNLKDIKTYCETNGIVYLTTMDILLEAILVGELTEAECDNFINDVKAKQSKLPCNTMAEYRIMKGI
jgi:predicted nucleic acid-binding protein